MSIFVEENNTWTSSLASPLYDSICEQNSTASPTSKPNISEYPPNITGYRSTHLTTLFSNLSTANPTEVKEDFVPAGLELVYNICVRYVSFFIWIFAFPANIFIICILVKRKDKNFSISFYFISLAVADLLVNFRTLQFWIDSNNFVTYTHDIECQISKGLSAFSMIASSWTLATISFERMLGVSIPHKVRLICTKRLARFWVTVIWVTSLGIGITNAWFYHSPNGSGCKIRKEEIDFFISYIAWADFILDIVLPFIIIMINSIVIVWHLSNRPIQTQTVSKTFGSSITVIVLTINIVFFITQFPYGLMFVYQQTNKRHLSAERLLMMTYIDGIVLVLKYLNNALNLYLYFLTGTKFRQETKDFLLSLKRLCFPLKNNNNRRHTVRASLSQISHIEERTDQELVLSRI